MKSGEGKEEEREEEEEEEEDGGRGDERRGGRDEEEEERRQVEAREGKPRLTPTFLVYPIAGEMASSIFTDMTISRR